MTKSHGYAAFDKSSPLRPYDFEHRDPNPDDVVIDIEFCGICHSDIHQVRDEWKNAMYPMVPGHEIVGRVREVGSAVKKYKPGQRVAVGVLVNSCLACENCKAQQEPYCVKGAVGTYNAKDYDGAITYGGYASVIVTKEHFVHSLAENLDPAGAAPLLCAGITTYSPLKHWGAGPGKKVGVVGLGGLGHLGLKFAHAFGAHTVQFTTSESKIADAKKLGADEVIISKDAAQMAKHAGTFDFILDCVSAEHDLNSYLNLLKLDGTLCLVGLPEVPPVISPFSLITNRRSLAGSMIGGMAETQQMLDYCAEKNIVADVEVIGYDRLEEAYDRVVRSDVKYRFVLDSATLKQQ
jgi:alcohol dehydrogenase (NADP+)